MMDPDLMMERPRCRCLFNPERGVPHTPACPAWRPPPSAGPYAEQRGTPHYVWQGGDGFDLSFAPFPGASCWYQVFVPIGWSMIADPDAGVLLAHTMRDQIPLDASDVMALALDDRAGFSVGETWWLGEDGDGQDPGADAETPAAVTPFPGPHDPPEWGGRVPMRVRVTRYVLGVSLGQPPLELMPGQEVPVVVNRYGAVSAVAGGRLLGLKPSEFEVTRWHLVPRGGEPGVMQFGSPA